MAVRPDCHGRCKLAMGSRPGLGGPELTESRRVICGRARVPALGSDGPRPQGREACSLQPGSRSPEPSLSPRLIRGSFCMYCLGKAETHCLPACGCSQWSGRLQSVSLGCLGPPAEKLLSLSLLASGTERQQRSVDRSPAGLQG